MSLANGMVRRRNAARGLTTGKRVRLVPVSHPSPHWVSDGRLRRERDSGRTLASSVRQNRGGSETIYEKEILPWNYKRLELI